MGLEEGKTYFDNTEIPKKRFEIDNGKFNITIRYQLDVASEKINDILIPLKAKNK
ncbi:hypothetical protein SAMD00020551_0498 [Mesobacillus selenatarsenatis SF-1]|uniref:Uncharacterized protein n=2 Tax=Mesobacillus selenatarsenatis TaxID=388741 RepID=A0A0A8WXH3_MESS1|nr:hypothetical protein SAMD00020551_0498 [Mesobacillus selenatarsenatis SF-1]